MKDWVYGSSSASYVCLFPKEEKKEERTKEPKKEERTKEPKKEGNKHNLTHLCANTLIAIPCPA